MSQSGSSTSNLKDIALSSCTEAETVRPVPESLLWAELSLLGVILIWGVNLPIMKTGLEHVNEYAFNAFRLTLSAIVLVVIALRDGGFSWKAFSSEQRWQIFRYAVLASGLYQVLFLLGLYRTTSANTALIMTSVPMWTALFARFFINERLTRLAWTGLIGAFLGTVVVTTANGISGESKYLWGNLIMLAAAVTWASSTVVSRPVLRSVSPIKLSAVSSVMMLPLHFLLAWEKLPSGLEALKEFDAWSSVLYSGVFSTGLALVMFNYGVRQTSAAHASVYSNLLPLVAMISAFLLRGESVTTFQIAGGVLIIAGLMVMRQGRRGG